MYTCNYIYGGGGDREMARVKSKHVQNSYLWMVKLQMILILIIFSVFYTMCIHYFHIMKIDLSVSLRRYLGLESSFPALNSCM